MTILLLMALPLAGMTVCPSGAIACPMMKQQAARDCCHERIGRTLQDCCGGGASHAPASLHALTSASHEFVPAQLLPALVAAVDALETGPAVTLARLAVHRGVAPPDTLVSQHVSLLL